MFLTIGGRGWVVRFVCVWYLPAGTQVMAVEENNVALKPQG